MNAERTISIHQGASIWLRASDEFAVVERERGLRSARDLPQQQLADLLVEQRTVKNIEAGVLVRGGEAPERIVEHVTELAAAALVRL